MVREWLNFRWIFYKKNILLEGISNILFEANTYPDQQLQMPGKQQGASRQNIWMLKSSWTLPQLANNQNPTDESSSQMSQYLYKQKSKKESIWYEKSDMRWSGQISDKNNQGLALSKTH